MSREKRIVERLNQRQNIVLKLNVIPDIILRTSSCFPKLKA